MQKLIFPPKTLADVYGISIRENLGAWCLQIHILIKTVSVFFNRKIELKNLNVLQIHPLLFFVQHGAPENFLKNFLNKKQITE